MIQRWSVGDFDIVRVDSANFLLPTTSPMPAWSVPGFTPSADQVPVAFSALAIRAGSATIVVDPWIVDDSPRSGQDAASVIDGLLAELSSVGVTANDVGLVINTHIDGIGWNTKPTAAGWRPTFPNARYLFPADELAAVDCGVAINGSEHLGPLADAGVIERIDPPIELAPGVTLIAAPGHNYGHVAVRIERDGQLAIYPGHLVLSLVQVDDPALDIGDTDFATASASRQHILGELAERRGLLLTTLIGGPGGGVVEPLGQGFRLGLDGRVMVQQ